MMLQMIVLFVMITLMNVNHAYAIDSTLHPIITAYALAEYNDTCVKGGAIPIAPELGEILVDSTEREDDLSLCRIMNWHFYDAYLGTKDAMKPCQSLHRIYGKRIVEFMKAAGEKNDKALYEAGGRILHYLQDMEVPAHVAPNYHAKVEKWWEKIFLANKPDPVDSYLDPAQINYSLSSEHCGTLQAMNDKLIKKKGNTPKAFFEGLLNELADNTRIEMKKTIPAASAEMRGKTWESVFWNMRVPAKDDTYPKNIKKGFAPYGGGDDQKLFNLTSGICTAEGNNDACRRFVQRRYEAAVDASVRMMMYTAAQAKP